MKRGITLIELLVVIAVLGLLISITAPALSSAREAARNVSCKNNLRQIGIALNAYHGAHARFPIGCVEWRPPGNTSNRQLAWSAFILPFAESSSTHELVDFNAPFDSEKNFPAASTVISMFLCPSSLHTTRTENGRGRSEYGGIYGERITSPNNPPKGMMLLN